MIFQLMKHLLLQRMKLNQIMKGKILDHGYKKSRYGLGIDSILSKIYYDPKTGYTGINYFVVKIEIKENYVQNWLANQ